jgi:hypothetical protein
MSLAGAPPLLGSRLIATSDHGSSSLVSLGAAPSLRSGSVGGPKSLDLDLDAVLNPDSSDDSVDSGSAGRF